MSHCVYVEMWSATFFRKYVSSQSPSRDKFYAVPVSSPGETQFSHPE